LNIEHSQALTIYNSLSRRKEPFKPLHEGTVGMYVCGPTVYGHSHIGHGKSYVSFDVMVRYLRHLGYKVLYVQNITDVGHLLDSGEDRMLKQSRIEKVHPMQVAETFTKSYFEDMDALGVMRSDISPRATAHIIEQIEMIKQLLKRGNAYEVEGSVYFDVRSFKEYGKLSGRSLDEAVEGTRVGPREDKRNPEDFALWKRAEPEHIMRWPSPWGDGYPGWHIECSAMSMKYLGQTFDIHGGGLENQFPHHECEIAQSESANGKPFVRYWVHNNMVTVNGQKMSKSLGNFVTLKDAFRKFDPLVVRFFVLQSHYRSTLDFSDEALVGAKTGWEKLIGTIRNVRAEITKAAQDGVVANVDLVGFKARFLESMNDDFNTPKAIAALFDLSRDVNQLLNSGPKVNAASLKAIDDFYAEYGGKILGIVPDQSSTRTSSDGALEPGLIQLLLDMRDEARKQKMWALSDLIRDRLKSLGVVIEDKKDGATWKLVR
jgi:cysteinyl-tRNA synthetase